MDRKQPVVTGLDKKGELVWGWIPMPRWQMLMFPLRYFGDFAAFWMKRYQEDKTGFESDRPSMVLRSSHVKTKPRARSGD